MRLPRKLWLLAAVPMIGAAGGGVHLHLVGRAASLRGQARELRFEFGRNLQVH